MNIQSKKTQTKKIFDLEERTAIFAEKTINILGRLPSNSINNSIVGQLVRSASSVGANYCEANEAESKSDFIHKISICKKEVKETKHWLRLLIYSNQNVKNDFQLLWKEAEELLLIFSAIIRTCRKK